MGEPGGPDLHREELLRRLDRAGLVDYQRALAALQDRAHTGKTAEEALVSAGLVSEITLTRLVADSYRIPFLSLADRYVAPEIARLVPRDVAENYALLPIGDNFTMGPKDARLAAELLQAPVVIPIHYSTWPVIAQDPEAFKADVEATTTSKVWVVKPGSTVEL